VSWGDILKNKPNILAEGIKKILTLKYTQSADKAQQNEMGEYRGNKQMKYNQGSFKMQIEVNDIGDEPFMYARIFSTPKTGIRFDYTISTENGKNWEERFLGERDDSINEEVQRKILSSLESINMYRGRDGN
tara:strand:- start:377 stop:772 length:396 start_codon:yes stop_codon:yes gene_type:complete